MGLVLLSSLAAIKTIAILIPDKSVLTQDNCYNTEHAPEDAPTGRAFSRRYFGQVSVLLRNFAWTTVPTERQGSFREDV
jgi:hypothetical protein